MNSEDTSLSTSIQKTANFGNSIIGENEGQYDGGGGNPEVISVARGTAISLGIFEHLHEVDFKQIHLINLVDKQILFQAGEQVKYWYFLIKGELSFSNARKSNKNEKRGNYDTSKLQSLSEEKQETFAQNSHRFVDENPTLISQKIINNSRNTLRSCFTAEENSRINTSERATRSRTPGMKLSSDNCLDKLKYPHLCEKSSNHRITCQSKLNSQVLAVGLSEINHLKQNNQSESISQAYDRRRYKKSKPQDDIYGPAKHWTPILSFQLEEIPQVENFLQKLGDSINASNRNILNQIEVQSTNASPGIAKLQKCFAPSRPLSHVSPKTLPLYPFQLPQESYQAPGLVTQQNKERKDPKDQYKLRDRNRLENINFAFSVLSNQERLDYNCQKSRKNDIINDATQSTNLTGRTYNQRVRKWKQPNISMIDYQDTNSPQIQFNQMRIKGTDCNNPPLSSNNGNNISSDNTNNIDLQLIVEPHAKENTSFEHFQQQSLNDKNVNMLLSHRENTKFRRKLLETPIFSDKYEFIPVNQKKQEDGVLFSGEFSVQQSFSRPSSSFMLHTKQRNSLPQNQNNLFPYQNSFQNRINRYYHKQLNNSNNEDNSFLVVQNHSYTSLSAEKQHKEQQQQQSSIKQVYQNKRSKSTCQSNINRVTQLHYQYQDNQYDNCLSQRTKCLSPQKELNRQTHSDNQINKVQLPPLKNSLLTRLAKYSEMRMQIKSAQNAVLQLVL